MSIYDTLNKEQKEAVLQIDGPLLILAGAGSGKTRVLTHRIAYMIEEKGVNPWNIMAITFTNKAAGEMRERVDQIVGFGSESIWVSTFHSSCVRILRRHIDRLGYDTNFTIYDGDDQKTIMKGICKRLEIDTKIYKERNFLSAISKMKDELISPVEAMLNAGSDFKEKKIATVYAEYAKELKNSNALDFDDLISKTVELFQNNPDVLEYYQDRFKYIMVDEYQDTNTAQFQFISILAKKYKNLCVVGDDDQSIYKFRGANIENILNFEKVYPDATVIKLEQNYRSTKRILSAANEVIQNNMGRKDKALWTDNQEGDPIDFHQFDNAYDEADHIVSDIRRKVQNQELEYKDCAILYRTNAQSRLFEERFVAANIPYKLVGGVNFYARKEIKDLLAYLKTIDNGKDDLAVKRIINVPKRGIGATTLGRVQEYAYEMEISFYDALRRGEEITTIGKSYVKLQPFVNYIQVLRSKLAHMPISEIMKDILEETGYLKELELEDSEESQARIENIDEFITKIVSYEEEAEEPTLSGFLEEVALVADIDSLEEDSNRVVLMTLHSAKGLEFPNVYLAGMEDGIFPSYMTITSDDPTEIEEERRLCYVGITRARENLTMTCARQRMIRGETQYNKMSRFVKEVPGHLLKQKVQEERIQEMPKSNAYAQAKKDFMAKPFERKAPTSPAKSFGATKAVELNYGVGDTVSHMKFGTGVVTGVIEGGKDFEVTVDFTKVGVKKMFASFAKLKKL